MQKKFIIIISQNSYHFLYIDTVFWSDNSQVQANNILFVGNDGNRDPEKFISAVKDLKNEKFVAVSNLDNFKILMKITLLYTLMKLWSQTY